MRIETSAPFGKKISKVCPSKELKRNDNKNREKKTNYQLIRAVT
jgi:hypothetical protein